MQTFVRVLGIIWGLTLTHILCYYISAVCVGKQKTRKRSHRLRVLEVIGSSPTRCPGVGPRQIGGEGGIRTLERFYPLHDFQSCAIPVNLPVFARSTGIPLVRFNYAICSGTDLCPAYMAVCIRGDGEVRVSE